MESPLHPAFRSFSILTGALWFHALPLKEELQGHADPLPFVAIVGMDWFKTTEKKNPNMFTKDNMHAFHLRSFKSSPLP